MKRRCKKPWRRLRPWWLRDGCLEWIHGQRLIRLLYEHARMLGALVEDDLDHDAAAAKILCVRRAINAVGLDQSPLAPQSPVAIEIRISVLRIFLLMLAPGGIVEVNSISAFVILMLKRGEEPIDDMFFRPIAERP